MDSLVERVLRADPRGLARALSVVEEGAAGADELLRGVYPHTGRATVVGLTGAPGSGKSSLADRLVAAYRSAGRQRVGVVAVDPSSAFSGGAILGDRVRMQGHASDPGVFIRSMATRGQLGGLARATYDAIDLLDAAGHDPILVETVGVGQDEVEVVKAADVVAVILMPGMGDDVQAIKAGILEIADLLVINKADRDGADRLHADLRSLLGSAAPPGGVPPAILRTVAVRGEGVDELRRGIAECLAAGGERRRAERRRERAEARLVGLLTERLLADLRRTFPGSAFAELVEEVAERRLDPYSAARRVLERLEVK